MAKSIKRAICQLDYFERTISLRRFLVVPIDANQGLTMSKDSFLLLLVPWLSCDLEVKGSTTTRFHHFKDEISPLSMTSTVEKAWYMVGNRECGIFLIATRL